MKHIAILLNILLFILAVIFTVDGAGRYDLRAYLIFSLLLVTPVISAFYLLNIVRHPKI